MLSVFVKIKGELQEYELDCDGLEPIDAFAAAEADIRKTFPIKAITSPILMLIDNTDEQRLA